MQLERQQEQFNELAADPNHWGPFAHGERLGGVGHGRSAGRMPMQGALFASSSEFLVRMAFGHKFRRGDHAQKCRSWKLFRLTSRVLLWRQKQHGHTKAELEKGGPLPQDVVAG